MVISISNFNLINMGKDGLKAVVIFFPICVLKCVCLPMAIISRSLGSAEK